MGMETILGQLVRVGIVTAVDNAAHKARVYYDDLNLPSGWLRVLDNRPFIPDYNVPQRTEYEAGGSGYPQFESHKHDLQIKQWMPKINQAVLTLYLPMKDADGFVLGGLS